VSQREEQWLYWSVYRALFNTGIFIFFAGLMHERMAPPAVHLVIMVLATFVGCHLAKRETFAIQMFAALAAAGFSAGSGVGYGIGGITAFYALIGWANQATKRDELTGIREAFILAGLCLASAALIVAVKALIVPIGQMAIGLGFITLAMSLFWYKCLTRQKSPV
jgi:hypothetical protein